MEQQELEAHIDLIRGLLQPSVRTRFPWGHDIFQSSYSMYIGGGMTETHHRYEDYFLFHANRRSSIRNVPQPNGAAFVRWFPQEGTWDRLYTDRGTPMPQEPIHTASSTPTDPIAPMATPFETPAQSPILSPSDNMPPPTPIQIHVHVETISVISPPDPHAHLVPSFSRSPSPEHRIPTLKAEHETTSMSPYADAFLPLSAMSQLSVAEWNDEPEPQPVTQPAANLSSRVIEIVEPRSLPLITTPSEPGYVLEYQQSSSSSSPPSLPFPPTSKPSSAPLTVEETDMETHKATYEEMSSDRTVSPMVIEIEEAPLPFMDTEFTLSPIPEAVELPTDLIMFSLDEPAFAPNVITASSSNTSPTTEPISDAVGWGMPSGQDYECHHDGTWDLCAAEWAAMNAAMDKAFSPPPFEDIPAWNYGYTSSNDQDQENGAEDNIREDVYMDEEIDTGTF
jgi:hypothetical protein